MLKALKQTAAVICLILILNLSVFSAGGTTIKVTTDKPGNVFFDGDIKEFNMTFSVAAGGVKYETFKDDKTTAVGAAINHTEVGTKDTVILPDLDYGMYCLRVTTGDGSVKEVPFSVCVRSMARNEAMGICAHFNWGYVNIDAGAEMLKNAGFSRIREGYSWQSFETKKNVFTEPDSCTEYLNAAEENDFKTLVLAGYNNTLYSSYTDAETGKVSNRSMPETDDEINAFANYAYELVKRNPHIEVLEVWNEGDINSFNPSEVPAETYAKLLKTVYERVKEDYPNVQISGYTLAGTLDDKGYKWLEDGLKADSDGDGQPDGTKYMDKLSVHTYVNSQQNSSAKGFANLVTRMDNIRGLLDEYTSDPNKNVEILVTEYGRSTIINSPAITKEQQAAHIARHTLLMMGRNMGEKYYVYNFADKANETAPSNAENHFGLVECHIENEAMDNPVALAAKPAFLAMANLNNLLAGYTRAEEIELNFNGKTVYKFTKPDETVYAMCNMLDPGRCNSEVGNGEAVSYSFTPGQGEVRFFDMYGNPLSYAESGGAYSLSLTNEPMYAVVTPEAKDSLTYMYDDKSGRLYVKAEVLTAEAGDNAAVKVYKGNKKFGEVCYEDNVIIDDGRIIKFSFEADPYADYVVAIEGEDFAFEQEAEGRSFLTYKYVGQSIKVDGTFPDGECGDMVGVMAYESSKAKDNIVFADQTELDNNKSFSFSFPAKQDLRYLVQVGSKSLIKMYPLNINDDIQVAITIENEDGEPNSFAALNAKKFVIEVELLNEGIDDFVILCGGYRGDMLTSIFTVDKANMSAVGGSDNRFETEIEANRFPNADNATFYIMDSHNSITPLARSIKF